jgi:DNA repair protein RadC
MIHRILDLPSSERPRERLKSLGPQALSSEELVAVILGSGSQKEPVLQVARKLVSHFRSLQGLGEASLEELQSISGIGLVKALQLKAAFALANRCATEKNYEKGYIRSPEKAFQMALPHISSEKREFFLILLLNIRMRLIGVEVVSIGTLSATLVHPREVFFQAIRRKASSLIAVHNHPSGDLNPSKDDLLLTQKLIEASSLVDIPLVDHLIISEQGFHSLRENGMQFAHYKGGGYVCSRNYPNNAANS